MNCLRMLPTRAMSRLLASAIAAIACLYAQLNAFSTADLNPVGYHLGGIAYYNAPYFSNYLFYSKGEWKDATTNTYLDRATAQFDSNGYPKYLNAGQTVFIDPLGLSGTYQEPSIAPNRENGMYSGQMVLTWKGDADVRIANASSQVSGTASGNVLNGRRVYIINAPPRVQIYSINASNPVTEIRAWLPDPTNPQNASLENQLFHPTLLARIADKNWSYIRFMDWNPTNASPQQDWVDRRKPTDAFQNGILNRRAPANGFTGNRSTDVALEYMIMLCNATGKDMWINVPHLATDDYIRKMAQTIAYGSNGVNPYTSAQSNPVYPPLNSGRKVYVEFSNEIWSNGNSFPQGNWAQDQANAQGITKAQFNARQFSRAWGLFEQYLGQARVVRTAACFTALQSYTQPFIDEFYNNSALLKPEVMAITTYFGQGIQNWAYAQNFGPATASSWTSPYWTSTQFNNDLNATYNQWNYYVLSGLSYGGATGFDNVATQGGFGDYIQSISTTRNLPLIAYEGGPSIYTDKIDTGGSANDDWITFFMEEFNRRQRFADIYYIHLNQAFARGLWSHMKFVDVSNWGKFGQWGHLEYFSQSPAAAPKYKLMLDMMDEFSGIRNPTTPLNAVPSFTNPENLPDAWVGQAYNVTINTTGGNGTRTVKTIGTHLVPGMTWNASTRTLSGTPTATGTCYIYLRVADGDGDPAWRRFVVWVKKRATSGTYNIDFEGLAVSSTVAEPLTQGSFQILTKLDGTGNQLEVIGTPTYLAKVLHLKSWGNTLYLKRTDNGSFDLTYLDVVRDKNSNQAASVFIKGSNDTGASVTRTYNLNLSTNAPQRVYLDWVSCNIVEVRFHQNTNGEGANRFGGIDAIQLNNPNPSPPS